MFLRRRLIWRKWLLLLTLLLGFFFQRADYLTAGIDWIGPNDRLVKILFKSDDSFNE